MTFRVLTEADVQQFMERGWVKVRAAFPKENALRAQAYVWEQVEKRGVYKDDPTTWTLPMVHIRENYMTEAFQACQTERLGDAIQDLIGVGRWLNEHQPINWGWWPVNFHNGRGALWDVPTEGWHVDGIHYPQYVHSREQGLLLLSLFSDVQPQGGGTVIAEGSHKVVADVLHRHPQGLSVKEVNEKTTEHPWFAQLTGKADLVGYTSRIEAFMHNTYTDENGVELRVVETTGEAGDVILGHPFIFHAPTSNLSGRPRFMANNQAPLTEDMCFNRSDESAYSPLELSIKAVVDA